MITHSKPWLIKEDGEAIDNLLKGGHITSGVKNTEFCDAIKDYLGVKNVYLTSTGSNALYISLLALGVSKYDEVIFPAYVCKSVLDAVKHIGATPVLCDIGRLWYMTPGYLSKHITSKTKAIIIVHPMGIYCDVEPFLEFNIPIIEDCCQCFAATINNFRPGRIGDISIYSFNATKCIATGEGGGISTDNERIADRIINLYRNRAIANPLSDLQCTLGISQLKRYNEGLKKREEIANIYFNNIDNSLLKDFNEIKDRSMYFRFLLTSDNIDFIDIKEKLFRKGICVRKGIDSILSIHENIKYENSINMLNRTISIPIYPGLDISEAKYISNSINNYLT